MKLEPRIKRVFIFANQPEDIDLLYRSVKPYGVDINLIGMETGVGSFLLDKGRNKSDLIFATADFGLFGHDLSLLGKYLELMGLKDLQVSEENEFYCVINKNVEGKLNDSCCWTNGMRFGCALYKHLKMTDFFMTNFFFLVEDEVRKNGVLIENPDKVILQHNPDALSINRAELGNGRLRNILF